MSSNYWTTEEPERVHVNGNERPCNVCKGLGYVLVHGQETDCIECEGYGSTLT